jgi:PAS domain-containing protein
LTLFNETAGALTGTLLRAQHSDAAHRYRLFATAAAELNPSPLLICDLDGRILETNQAAKALLGTKSELGGRRVMMALRSHIPSIPTNESWLKEAVSSSRVFQDNDKNKWRIEIKIVGPQDHTVGYCITLIQD